jgi:hypothetical protein
LNYNNGALIEAEKFDETAEELCNRFGGVYHQNSVRTKRKARLSMISPRGCGPVSMRA